MAILLDQILDQATLAALQTELANANWQDGGATAGPQARAVKSNQQLAGENPTAKRAAALITQGLAKHAGFIASAFPRCHTIPMFSRYEPGQAYGPHIDNALRIQGDERLRCDLAATLFLSDPSTYDGGELIIETGLGTP